jgi:hypothetical protein
LLASVGAREIFSKRAQRFTRHMWNASIYLASGDLAEKEMVDDRNFNRATVSDNSLRYVELPRRASLRLQTWRKCRSRISIGESVFTFLLWQRWRPRSVCTRSRMIGDSSCRRHTVEVVIGLCNPSIAWLNSHLEPFVTYLLPSQGKGCRMIYQASNRSHLERLIRSCLQSSLG